MALIAVACKTEDPNVILQERAFVSGTSVNVEQNIPTIDNGWYREKNRPQIHFTPEKNWINAPNGMVYADGIWNIYY